MSTKLQQKSIHTLFFLFIFIFIQLTVIPPLQAQDNPPPLGEPASAVQPGGRQQMAFQPNAEADTLEALAPAAATVTEVATRPGKPV